MFVLFIQFLRAIFFVLMGLDNPKKRKRNMFEAMAIVRAAKMAEKAARRAEEAEKDTNLSAMTNEMELEETFAIQDLAERVREGTE